MGLGRYSNNCCGIVGRKRENNVKFGSDGSKNGIIPIHLGFHLLKLELHWLEALFEFLQRFLYIFGGVFHEVAGGHIDHCFDFFKNGCAETCGVGGST